MAESGTVTRRDALTAIMFAGTASSASLIARAAAAQQTGPTVEPAQTSWSEVPPQVSAVEHTIDVGGARLWAWDTGGTGPAVILMHAYTGSGAAWGYQQPVLARAGYRVIGYSRRGHFRSERGPEDAPGTMIGDLLAIADRLDVARFHLVGTAAGGFSIFDCALAHPERLFSVTLASSQGGIDEPEYLVTNQRLLPPGWRALPAEFREVGPSYRAANPRGTQRWIELEQAALVGDRLTQGKVNRVTWDALKTITTPVLLMTGGADLYSPPSRLREIAACLQNCRTAILTEAGHAAFWEQPEAFNRQLVAHLDANSPTRRGATG
ncbi:MAG: alpha/beta hydrolase [Gammaproteobacteria bacterium]|nr:alpha/beta hydrolase [Gammaproteobacteria bacterium]